MEQIPGQPLESFPSASSLFLYVQDTLDRDGAGVIQHIAKEFGYSIEEAECAGVDFLRDFVHPEDTGQLDLLLTYWEKAPSASSLEIEMRVRHADGNWRWIRLGERVLDRLADGPVQRVIGACCDITTYKAAEERARTLTRLYAIRSRINQAIVQVREPLSLFREACRIAVEEGAFRMAWVGLADEGTKEVEPVAWAGVTDGYLEKLKIVLHDEPHGRGPTGRALNQGLHVVCRDIEHDPSMEPWRAEALQRGYRSSAAFPLKVFGQTRGALNLYASEPGAFGDEILELLDGLAMDLSFALEYADQESLGQEVQEALRASEERFRAFFHNAGVGMAVVDKAGCVVVANEADAHFLGYHPDELAGMHFSQFTHPDDLSADAELYQALLRGDRASYTIDKRYLRKDGQTVWGHLAVSLVRDAAGSPLNTVVVCEDITGRKQAQEALRLSEERFKYISQTISDFAYTCTKPPEGCFSIDWLTGAVESITGYTFEEVQSWGCWILLVVEEDLPIFNTKVIGLSPGESSVCELRIRHKDGSVKCLMAFTVCVPDSDDPLTHRLYGGCHDITERKRAEEERLLMERSLLQTQKLESLGVLAGGIAHDFNNLLMAVLGYADLALLDLSDTSPARPKILEIVNASRRAADLCRQMLAYSGKGKFLVERMTLTALIDEMIQLLKTCISKKALLNLNLEPNLPPIEGDPSQIRQILMNLVINASEAIGERSGVITISTGARHCDRDYLKRAFLDDNLPEGLYVSLEVSDTGSGMDRETQARIFEPFFTTKFSGRGLGMAAVLGIVRGHKGSIRVYSEPGKGTTFRLLFPASQHAGEMQPMQGAVVAEDIDAGTVLLVDDEETVLAVGKQMLERLGFSVLTAQDGLEALEIYGNRSSEISCVLLDLTMPHLNGEEAFRELRRLNPDVKVIISSGYSEQDITSRFSGKGLAGFIQKPYETAKLGEVMDRALKTSHKALTLQQNHAREDTPSQGRCCPAGESQEAEYPGRMNV